MSYCRSGCVVQHGIGWLDTCLLRETRCLEIRRFRPTVVLGLFGEEAHQAAAIAPHQPTVAWYEVGKLP